MHDEPTCEAELPPGELEAQREKDVLRHLLDSYPAVFGVDELLSELTTTGMRAEGEREAFASTIGDMAARGVLHQHDSYIWPTRAAKNAARSGGGRPRRRCAEKELDPAERDDQLQMAVLGHLLSTYPAPLTRDEIVTALEDPFQRSFEDTDDIQRALRDLVCDGLLRENDGSVLPTRATFRFSDLVGL